MSENVKKEPDIRFEGFVDDWEQRQLGKISDKVKEKNKTGEVKETLTNSAEYGIISQRDFFDKAISNSKNLESYYVVKNDDFVYNPRISNFAPVGPIKRNKLGRTGVMSPLYYVFRTKDVNKNFLEKYFDTNYWNHFMELNGDSGARSDRFAIKDSVFSEMPIPYPLIVEQEKIGQFFIVLDDTITLHQQKLELLKKTKKGYLQKMFPKNGETVPEIRFDGFSDEWGVKTLGKIFDTITDYVANGSFESLRNNVTSYSDENYAYMIRLQDASNNWKGPWLYTDKDGYDFLNKSELHPNDIIMSNVGSVGKFFLIPELDKPMTLAPNAVLIRSSKNDERFLYQMMLTNSLQVAVKKKTTPGVQSKINKTDFKKIKTQLPSAKEQFKIGNFFKTLDEIVDMEEKTLKELKSLKKSLLQKMFI